MKRSAIAHLAAWLLLGTKRCPEVGLNQKAMSIFCNLSMATTNNLTSLPIRFAAPSGPTSTLFLSLSSGVMRNTAEQLTRFVERCRHRLAIGPARSRFDFMFEGERRWVKSTMSCGS